MPNSHDFAVARPCAYIELEWQTDALRNQRMVAPRAEWIGYAAEKRHSIMVHFAGLAMHDVTGGHNAPAKRFAHALKPQADAKDRYLSGERADQRDADACI